MTGIPASIRVGYRDILIVVTPQASDRHGDYEDTPGIIHVTEDRSDQLQAYTVLHEALHACWALANLGDKADEEKAITGLSTQFAQVWRDNPDLVAYLSDALRP